MRARDRIASLVFFVVGALAFQGVCQYAFGQNRQRSPVELTKLLKVIDDADKVVVFATDGSTQERQIYSTVDPKDISALRASLAVQSPEPYGRCACIPSTVLRFYRQKQFIGDLAIFFGEVLRFSRWSADADVTNTKPWFEWLDQRGITTPRREFERNIAEEQKSKADEARWLKAMPGSMQPLWPAVVDPPGRGGIVYTYDTRPLEVALTKEFPGKNTRILKLLAWYGSGAGPWSGCPAYESAAEQMLSQYPIADLVAVLQGTELTEEQTEGAARYLADFTRSNPSEIALLPAQLKLTLLEHSLKSSDEDKQARARRAFATAPRTNP